MDFLPGYDVIKAEKTFMSQDTCYGIVEKKGDLCLLGALYIISV
jgi:hypothetical protein